VQLLLDKGASIDEAAPDGRTALWYAAGNGCLEIAQLLVKKGASINRADVNGRTPLYNAAASTPRQNMASDHLKTVRLLLDNGARTDIASNSGVTPLDAARQKGYSGIAGFLSKQRDLPAAPAVSAVATEEPPKKKSKSAEGSSDAVAASESGELKIQLLATQSAMEQLAERLVAAESENASLRDELTRATHVDVTDLTGTGDDERPPERRCGDGAGAAADGGEAAAATGLAVLAAAQSQANAATKVKVEAARAEAKEAAREDAEDSMLCVVCMVAPRDVVFTGCSHLICCLGCATAIRDGRSWAKTPCPMGGHPIKGVVKQVRMP